ncbi:MAG: thioredoxin family protein [Verrucomicrobiales bacterium]|nr:thioredoxin family protein [Verrucomicrobiales bacterium]
MAEVPSTFQLKTGQKAPDFTLPDARGKSYSLETLLEGKNGLLVAFVCNHCPFVVHLAGSFGSFADEMIEKGIQVVAINANDIENYPADSPEKMVEFAEVSGWNFPYLYDESQKVAKAYAAACTPDFYLFDSEGLLSYAGQYDDSRPGRGGEITGHDLRNAVENLISGEATPGPWYPSTGCNIKWKAGEAPDYFG